MTEEQVQALIDKALREERRGIAFKIRMAAPSKMAYIPDNEGSQTVRDFANDLANSLEKQCEEEEKA